MNPEIKTIIEDMKKKCPGDTSMATPYALQNYLSVQMSRLLVLLAEEAKRQSNKIADQTEADT